MMSGMVPDLRKRTPSKKSKAVFIESGRRGGLIGGRRSAEALTPEQRKARATKAAAAATLKRQAKAAAKRAAAELDRASA